MSFDANSLKITLERIRQRLLDCRQEYGVWQGYLGSSALSTATAVFALALAGREKHAGLIFGGLEWLKQNVNRDGGWGDTTISSSNLSATVLCWSALAIAEEPEYFAGTEQAARQWINKHAGGVEPIRIIQAVDDCYGQDKTFSVPILTMCALAGRLGDGMGVWRLIKQLPFELALLPHGLFRFLRLHVVSYAMPALIAMGRVNYHFCKPLNPFVHFIRAFASKPAMEVLGKIQPTSGGFLEAVPLTAFTVMCLAQSGQINDSVVKNGVNFLVASVRPDGSWSIDTNLATWVTSLSVRAMAESEDFEKFLSKAERKHLCDCLLVRQFCQCHPYTHARPGGWAWTDLPGAVPDADDTAAALIALKKLAADNNNEVIHAAKNGLKWLLGLQNSDGGIATFCRGWGRLPFDRSCPDITSHAVAAWRIWADDMDNGLRRRLAHAARRALKYLAENQRPDGCWIPLWFGNESAPTHENPVYGTARVLSNLTPAKGRFFQQSMEMLTKAANWLMRVQNTDGGWGGAEKAASSIEETSLAIDAIAGFLAEIKNSKPSCIPTEPLYQALCRGVQWLIENTNAGTNLPASPIGLYFARLWYYEQLYPVIFALSALHKADRVLDS